MAVARQPKSAFVDVTPVFTLKDIGSKIIDQLSTDVYTGAGSILRELVKNAYDAYLGLDPEDFESGEFSREIVVSREREANGTGRLFIADGGIGQCFEDLKANVQISISRKPDELENATGFRGLGSWASLGAGSKIVIASTKKGDPHENRLTIDVRKVYSLLSPKTNLDDILNNKGCIRIAQGPAGADDHYTTIEIVCDGPVESVKGHELNRLYDYTDPVDTELRRVLVQHCAVPYVQDGDVHKKIHEIYSKVGYIRTPIVLDGTTLERRLPENLSAFESTPLKIGDQVVAIAWKVHNPDATGEIVNLIDEEEHNLAGPAIQLTKLNVPIGPKRLYNDQHVREGLLDWYVGEVHILAPDILPNASGDGLRSGTAKDAFIPVLRGFYRQLEQEAEKKSQRISLRRNLRNAKQAAAKIVRGGLSPIQESQEKAKVGKGVELLN
ncbi:MAG: ATP-binding protein, partial [Isosphaerales bacterium]